MAKRTVARRRKLHPGAHVEILLNYGQVQVVRWTLLPGASTPFFQHHCPYVVLPRTDGVMERVIRKGRKLLARPQKLIAGQPYVRLVGKDGLEQSFRNVGFLPVIFEKMLICCHLPLRPGRRAKAK